VKKEGKRKNAFSRIGSLRAPHGTEDKERLPYASRKGEGGRTGRSRVKQRLNQKETRNAEPNHPRPRRRKKKQEGQTLSDFCSGRNGGEKIARSKFRITGPKEREKEGLAKKRNNEEEKKRKRIRIGMPKNESR